MSNHHKYLAVIPCHDEAATIGRVVSQTLRAVDTVIVVNDGSTDRTADLAREAGAEVLSLPRSGKGAALRAGLDHALSAGATHALCLDGDGQHLPNEAARLLSASNDDRVMVIGNRMRQSSRMPLIRRWTNRTMSRVLSLLTGATLKDSQCGFRVVPLIPEFLASLQSRHFEIESELILRAVQFGLGIRFVDISCVYHQQRSHIHSVSDTLRWLLWLWESTPDRVHHKP